MNSPSNEVSVYLKDHSEPIVSINRSDSKKRPHKIHDYTSLLHKAVAVVKAEVRVCSVFDVVDLLAIHDVFDVYDCLKMDLFQID